MTVHDDMNKVNMAFIRVMACRDKLFLSLLIIMYNCLKATNSLVHLTERRHEQITESV